jgi:multisubunit Na+/H+ antiporter MnhE subunit
MKLLLTVVCAWIALFWLWLLWVGQWNPSQWAAAAVAATVASAAVGVVVHLGGTGVRFRPAWLAPAGPVLVGVVVDFAILTRELGRALVRRRLPQGVFRAVPLDEDGHERADVIAILATYSPNAYVVDVDRERGLALVHDLVPRRSSESPL